MTTAARTVSLGSPQFVSVRPKRSPALAVPAQFNCDPVVWAAWLYHHDGLNQSQIAEVLDVSRASVVKYLQQARARDVVTVAVQPNVVAVVEASLALQQRFGLAHALVIPDDGGMGEVSWRVGQAGARWLTQELRPRDVLGVAWGRTVLALSQSLPRASLPDLTVVQIIGSRSNEEGFSAEQCTSNIAARLGARCVNIFAPAVLSRPDLCEMLLQEPLLKEQFVRMRACTRALIGICTVKHNSLIFDSWLISAEVSRDYLARGAVGVICGRFFDAAGQPVLGELDERMVGLSLDELARVPIRLAVAGGGEKTAALLGALRGGHLTELVTDERTAQRLLAAG